MRVIVKHPGQLPVITTIGNDYTDLQHALGDAFFEACMRDGDVVVWCDEEYLLKEPRPELNVRRPNDGHPICGTVVVTGTVHGPEGDENGDLSDADAAMWMFILVACAAQEPIDEQASERRTKLLGELRLNLTPDQQLKAGVIESMVDSLGELLPDCYEPRFTFFPG